MSSTILERVQVNGTPLIEKDVATFVWVGERAPFLIGDFTGWEEGDPAILAKVEPGIWTYKLALPPNAYIEYAFIDQGQRLEDPYNPNLTSNGMGKYNHYFYMPEGKPTPLMQPSPETPHGQVERKEILAQGFLSLGRRGLYFYQPPTPDPVPLIVVWDGSDYLQRASLAAIMDALIAERRIQPAALVLVDNGGANRTLEYACSDITLGFLLTEVLPLAEQQLNLLDIHAHPGAYAVMGASMGGLMALYAGLRLPHIFGKVLSQSGAFAFGEYDTVSFDLVRDGPQRPIRIWMDVGLYDMPALLTANRRMHSLLESRGYPVAYREYNGGHNYPAWRDDLWRGLEYLFA